LTKPNGPSLNCSTFYIILYWWSSPVMEWKCFCYKTRSCTSKRTSCCWDDLGMVFLRNNSDLCFPYCLSFILNLSGCVVARECLISSWAVMEAQHSWGGSFFSLLFILYTKSFWVCCCQEMFDFILSCYGGISIL